MRVRFPPPVRFVAYYSLAGILAGCGDRNPIAPAPLLQTGTALTAPGDSLFYYHQGVKIELTPDSTQLVFEAAGSANLAAADAILASEGLTSVRSRIPGFPDHYFVALRQGSPGTALLRASARMRESGQFLLAEPVYTAGSGRDTIVPLNQIAVQFKSGVTQAQVDDLNARFGTSVIASPRPDSGRTWFLLRYPVPTRYRPYEMAAILDRHPLVSWAGPDHIQRSRRPFGPATDPFYSAQFYLKNAATYNGVPVDINVEPAWDLTLGSTTIRVAVLDDGAEAQHGELFAALGGGQSFDQMLDERLPGETDDVLNPFGDDRHGTAVAGIIFAARNSFAGGAGIAPNVKLHVARIFRRTNHPTPGRQVAPPSEIGAAINWAWQSGADVISNSWGGGTPDNAITSAINSATASGRSGKGSVVVFAAGNYDPATNPKPVVYPANLPNVVAVGAITQLGPRATYSAQGPELDLVAPSATAIGLLTDPSYCTGNVFAVDPLGASGCNDGPGSNADYSSTFGGTSAAAPQVAGVVALLFSLQRNLTES